MCIRTNTLLHNNYLHWATCLATFKSVALQLHEQGCYTVQWDSGQQLAKLRPRRTKERIIRILIGWSSKALWDKLHWGCYTAQHGKSKWNRCEKFYFLQRLRQQRKLRDKFGLRAWFIRNTLENAEGAVKMRRTVLKMRITCKQKCDRDVRELWIAECALFCFQSWSN